MPQILLTPVSAARLVGMSVSRLRTIIRGGGIKAVKQPDSSNRHGYVWRVPKSEALRLRDTQFGDGRGFPRGRKRTGEQIYCQSTLAGYYVYGWYQRESPLPFYVGKGHGRRAEECHQTNDGSKSQCQVVRELANGFSIKIFKSGLTNRESLMAELTLIRAFKSIGGCQCNSYPSGRLRRYH